MPSELWWGLLIAFVVMAAPELILIPVTLVFGLIAMILLGIAAAAVVAWEWFTQTIRRYL